MEPVDVQPNSDANPSDNTRVTNYNDYLRSPPVKRKEIDVDGPSIQERTKQADAVDKWLAKHVDMQALDNLTPKSEAFPDVDKYPQWIEGIKEWFDGPDFEPTGDSIMTYWPDNPYGSDDTVPMVRPYVNGGGVSGVGRPGHATDTLNKSTGKAKEFFR